MCSINLNTRVKDKRNLIANLSFEYDKTNTKYQEEDDEKKCEIFGISNSKTDFITHKPLTGIGDHYYPLCGDIKKYNRIGSDSLWNRIPVNGNNRKYKTMPEYQSKLKEWITYTESKNVKMYYNLSTEHLKLLKELESELVRINKKYFEKLCTLNHENA